MTLENACNGFMIEQRIRGNTEKTVRYYGLCLRLFARFAGADTEMEQITTDVLKCYYMHLADGNVTTITVQTYIRAVRAFLTWCYYEEIISENLAEKFRLPKAQRKTVDVLTDSEIRRLFDSFNLRNTVALRNACVCSLMLDCGLRLNEVVTLTIDHLHLADGYAIVNGKGNKQRIIPLGYYTRKLLVRYLSRRPLSVTHTAVFVQRDLAPITDNTLRLVFRRLKTQANIPRIRAHLLRHTFATKFLQNGGDVYSLQQILGHTSLEMVKRYVHFTPAKMQSTHIRYSPLDNLLKA